MRGRQKKSKSTTVPVVEGFTWIPLYRELAQKLPVWEGRQGELISLLEQFRTEGYVITPLLDRDADGSRFLLGEIDPFTFFGVFNRRTGYEQRLAILARLKEAFQLESELPEDFDGLPVLSNFKSWFFPDRRTRRPDDVRRLWRVFHVALGPDPLSDPEFHEAFDEALRVRQTNVNLTIGLFWIRPETFLSLDQTNRSHLGLRLPEGGLNAQYYTATVRSYLAEGLSFPALSLEAWGAENERQRRVAESREAEYRAWGGVNYWLVGAQWDDRDPADQTQRFLEEGIWEIGPAHRFSNEVFSMRVNDRIAIKAASTQRKGLPFDARGRTVPRLTIKAAGTIVANRGDGQTVEVEWDPAFEEKPWYFHASRKNVWRLRTDSEYARRLRDFVWLGRQQDYDWFLEHWGDPGKSGREADSQAETETEHQPYGLEDLAASGVFLEEDELARMLERLHSRKAMILQGPPGVGKTFISRKLAYALMKEVDHERLEMVQFHQSYSYDDFVRGYRPSAAEAGGFALKNGVFHEFCQRAIADPEREYVFIIDEINRGNLSQIFGELLMLIEADKRGPEFGVPLVYHQPEEPRFYVPQNLYVLGLMNLADRSLAMVDYALRRRFVFISLKPQYESPRFRSWLTERGMNPALVRRIVERMSALNRQIREDPLLGENYEIGHSYFLPRGDDFTGLDRAWYEGIVRTEILPLLKEYWFDDPARTAEAEEMLLS